LPGALHGLVLFQHSQRPLFLSGGDQRFIDVTEYSDANLISAENGTAQALRLAIAANEPLYRIAGTLSWAQCFLKIGRVA
jgi:hypothetical protein